MSIQKEFGKKYKKKENAGFVGEEAIIRTPTREEVMECVMISILHIVGLNLLLGNFKIIEEFIQRYQNIEKRTERINKLIDDLYFESCSMCDDADCREWVDVYGENNEVFCHVSDCELEEINPMKSNRINELKNLQSGWLDGEGKSLSKDGLEWLEFMLKKYFPIEPYIYPTPEGRVHLEWTVGSRELTLGIDLGSHVGEFDCFDLASGKGNTKDIDLNDPKSWEYMIDQINKE